MDPQVILDGPAVLCAGISFGFALYARSRFRLAQQESTMAGYVRDLNARTSQQNDAIGRQLESRARQLGPAEGLSAEVDAARSKLEELRPLRRIAAAASTLATCLDSGFTPIHPHAPDAHRDLKRAIGNNVWLPEDPAAANGTSAPVMHQHIEEPPQ